MQVRGDDQKRLVRVIDKDTITGWLFTIKTRKIRELKKEAWACLVIMTKQAEDGQRRDVTVIDLDTMTGWLFTINAGKVREEIRLHHFADRLHLHTSRMGCYSTSPCDTPAGLESY